MYYWIHLISVPLYDELPKDQQSACLVGTPMQELQVTAVAHEGGDTKIGATTDSAAAVTDGTNLRH